MDISYQSKYYTVTEITKYLKANIENNPEFNNVWVKGEIYNLTYHSSGHIYFTLKDNGAVLSAVFFKYSNKNLKFRLEEGMSILACGSLTLFEKRGSYQINVIKATPEGVGELQKHIEQLKKKFSQEGLFDPERKKPLPFLPARIGVVTSPTGAAIKDVIKVALRRFENIEIILAPAKVQGNDAAITIAAGIKELNKPQWNIDVIIAGRGGGSFEDLMPFNEEIVVKAFANSKVPIISAVGHQIDNPLSDHVADAFAPTPSAAAELAIPLKSDLIDELRYISMRINNALINRFKERSNRLTNLTHRKIFKDPFEILTYREMVLNDLERKLISAMKNIIAIRKEKLLHIPDICQTEKNFITQKKHSFNMKLQAIEKLSPLNIISRGYSIVTDKDNNIIKSAETIKEKDVINIKLAFGRITATVNSITREK